MASSTESSPEPQVTWSQKFTDFAIRLQSGRRVKAHKHVLAENSEVFEAMLTQELEEAKNNEMSLEHFEDKTVFSFIEYLYADKIKDQDIIDEVKCGALPNEYIFKRSFCREKLTIDLLKMAHMYQVEDLKMDCREYLHDNICDGNVMEIWMGAERLEYKGLSSTAIQHLVDRPKGKTLTNVPGFNEAFQDNVKPLQDLMGALSIKGSSMKEDISNLIKENSQLKLKLKRLEEPQVIKVTLMRWTNGAMNQWSNGTMA